MIRTDIEKSQIDTIPKSLIAAFRKYGDQKIAMRQKKMGIWQCYTWAQSYEQVRSLCLGLIELGLKPGDKVCIIGDNDPQYYWAQMAVQSIRGITVGIYTDSTSHEVQFIVENADAVFIFAKDQEQCDKILEFKDQVPAVRRVIYWKEDGLWNYDEPWLIHYKEVQALGMQLDSRDPDLFENLVDQGCGEDLAIFCYTSGTTGNPKGVMHDQKSLVSCCDQLMAVDPRTDEDEYVSYLPPAWIVENVLGLTVHLRTGMVVNFPEKPEVVRENIREVAPQCLLFSPRQWEGTMSMVQVKIAEATWLNRFLYERFMPVGYKVADLRYEKRMSVSPFLRILYALGDFAVFQPLRDSLGLTRIDSAYSSGAALNPDVIRFFRAIGVSIKNLYGSTEAQVCTLHFGDDVKFETVGQPIPGVEIVISDDNEILISANTVFKGYYKDHKATADALHKDEEGRIWFHTGDAGYMGSDGHLVYLERLKEMITLANGDKYSPQYLEGQLKFSPYIRDVMTIGSEDKSFVSALVNIDFEYVGRWAEKQGLAYTTYVDLTQKPEVYELIRTDIERVNNVLPSSGRIRRFVLLHKEFDADEGELTRTRKLRRVQLSRRYDDIIRSTYNGGNSVKVNAPVKYRDGRQAVIETTVRIATLET